MIMTNTAWIKNNWVKLPGFFLPKANVTSPAHYWRSANAKPNAHPVSQVNPLHKFYLSTARISGPMSASWKSCRFSNRILQCESDFRPFNMRRRSTSMPLCELILLIQPWVLLRLMFLGWYSVPLFRVRTCWYCHGSCGKTPEPSACEESGPHLESWGPAAALDTIQLLNDLRWEVPVTAWFPAGMLMKEHRLNML